MGFWSTLASKEVDIYIGIATTILGLILGEALNWFKRKGPPPANPTAGSPQPTVQVHAPVSISTINNIYNNNAQTPQRGDDGSIRVVLFVLLVATAVIYLNFRSLILEGVTSVCLLLMVLFAGVHLAGFLRGVISGPKWFGYLVYLACFYLAAVMVRDKAVVPSFAPQFFVDSEAIVRRYGMMGFGRLMRIPDWTWLLLHITGVVLFLSAIVRHLLAGLYLSAMTWHLGRHGWGSAPPWLAMKTARYRHVLKNMATTTVLLGLAYVLVSGDAYMWWTYEYPKVLSAVMRRILHGAP